jgi:hypothetical protein
MSSRPWPVARLHGQQLPTHRHRLPFYHVASHISHSQHRTSQTATATASNCGKPPPNSTRKSHHQSNVRSSRLPTKSHPQPFSVPYVVAISLSPLTKTPSTYSTYLASIQAKTACHHTSGAGDADADSMLHGPSSIPVRRISTTLQYVLAN